MDTGQLPEKLHLPDLKIQGFCGLRDLAVNRLGRVTLITGMNGVGKTTVLDAIRIFANRGSPAALIDILQRRNEFTEFLDENGDFVPSVTWSSLFYQRRFALNSPIIIGPRLQSQQLVLRPTRLPDQPTLWNESNEEDTWGLTAEYEMWKRQIPMLADRASLIRVGRRQRHMMTRENGGIPTINCEVLGPGLLTDGKTLDLWSAVALTDAETRALEALNFLGTVGRPIERIAVVGTERAAKPRAIVRLAGEEQPIPLSSLGDGAVRVFGVALALSNSLDGFLLIDEAENGIHHSVQSKFWRMMLQSAQQYNVQVIATSHSWDAVAGFANAVAESDGALGALVRLETDNEGDVFAVEYSEEELQVIAEQGIEVR